MITKGFKLVTLSHLLPTHKLMGVLAYRLLPIQQYEITMSEELIDEVLAAFDAYDDRSLVENAEYRELMQGFRLPLFIGKDASSIAAYPFFEVLLFSVIALYQQQRASRYVAQGIRRLRRVAWKERLEVVVYVGY